MKAYGGNQGTTRKKKKKCYLKGPIVSPKNVRSQSINIQLHCLPKLGLYELNNFVNHENLSP